MAPETQDKSTLHEFSSDPAAFLERLRRTGEPLTLTVDGEGEVVVQDADTFRRHSEHVERLETLAAIREGLEDIAAGRTRPAREVMMELARKHNLPPPEPE